MAHFTTGCNGFDTWNLYRGSSDVPNLSEIGQCAAVELLQYATNFLLAEWPTIGQLETFHRFDYRELHEITFMLSVKIRETIRCRILLNVLRWI